MGGGHHHGGGGFRGGFGPVWGGYGYPVQYAYPEVFVVDNQPPADDAAKQRAMAYVMSLPKAQRPAAYVKLFGQPAPAGVLGDWPAYQYMNAGGMALDWRQKTGGMSAPWTQPYEWRGGDARSMGGYEMTLPYPGAPEVPPAGSPLGDCGCGCKGTRKCKGVGDVDDASKSMMVAVVMAGAIGIGLLMLTKKSRSR